MSDEVEKNLERLEKIPTEKEKLEFEAKLIANTDNRERPEDGDQPPQDKEPFKGE